MKKIKLKFGKRLHIFENRENTMLECLWQDNDKVTMLSTVGYSIVTVVEVNSKKGKRSVHKLNSQVSYNKYIGGADRFDLLFSNNSSAKKSWKCFQTITHFVTKVVLVKGYIVYNTQNPGKNLLWKFKASYKWTVGRTWEKNSSEIGSPVFLITALSADKMPLPTAVWGQEASAKL